jgi:hypothetical protein
MCSDIEVGASFSNCELPHQDGVFRRRSDLRDRTRWYFIFRADLLTQRSTASLHHIVDDTSTSVAYTGVVLISTRNQL